jgi:hypothetical protein
MNPAVAALVVIAVLAGVVGYAMLCMYLVVVVTLPVAVFALAAGALFGVATALIMAYLVFTGRLPVTVLTPRAYVRDLPRGPLPPDDAWPEYLARQVFVDVADVADRSLRLIGFTWKATYDAIVDRVVDRPVVATIVLALWPMPLPIVLGLAAWSAATVAGVLFLAVVAGVVAALGWVLGFVVVAVLRGADRVWRRRFRTSVTCPRCYHETVLPAYMCRGAHRTPNVATDPDGLHFNLQPGWQGVWTRRCGCGENLVTGMLRASERLDPWCPMCVTPLHRNAGVATDVSVALFGAPSTGKTELLSRIVCELVDDCGAEPGDAQTDRRYRQFGNLRASGKAPLPTDPTRAPVALTIALSPARRRSALLHFFDASGEVLIDGERWVDLAYFLHARTMLLVVDPFALKRVKAWVREHRPSLFERARASTSDVEQSYQAAVVGLRINSIETRRRRLAIVLTKADLLSEQTDLPEVGDTSSSIQAWLAEHDLDNVVLAADRDFGAVRYFRWSEAEAANGGTLAPLRWLLSAEPLDQPIPHGTPHAR